MTNKICCNICEKRFETFHDDQAYGCAATSRNGRIYGYYGSTVADMRCFKVVGEPIPDHIVVCDDCLKSWIASGRIVADQEFAKNVENDRLIKPTDPIIAQLVRDLRA